MNEPGSKSKARYGKDSSSPRTARQYDLDKYKREFAAETKSGSQLLTFLQRSECGVWRCERDKTDRRRWWINITLPNNVAEMFDAHLEILLVYVEYEDVEPRLLELIHSRMAQTIRVDSGIFMIASYDTEVKRLLRRRRGEYAAIDLDLHALGPQAPDIRDRMAEVLTTVDHYDMTTPVHDPGGFFGRDAEFQEIVSDIERGQSVGIFGLRKTGKTSLLNYVARRRREANRPVVSVDVSGLSSADDFRLRVVEATWKRVSELASPGEPPRLRTLDHMGDLKVSLERLRLQWLRDLQALSEHIGQRLELFIDEIDQLHPDRSTLGSEARELYVALTQLRGMIQTPEDDKGIVLVCAGVDPALFDRPLFQSGADNLLYKLVRLLYLAPLTHDEMAEMVRDLGRRMGVRVRSHEVIDFLFSEYGGHALLTRKACSVACKARPAGELPWRMTLESIEHAADQGGEGSPLQQAGEILESFSEWFPNEASVLRDLWSRNSDDRNLATMMYQEDPNVVRHAAPYGLLNDGTCEARIRAVERAVSESRR